MQGNNNAEAICDLAAAIWADQTQAILTFPVFMVSALRPVAARDDPQTADGDAMQILNRVGAIGWVLRHWSVVVGGTAGSQIIAYPVFGRP